MKQQASSSLKKNTADNLTDKIRNYAANRHVNVEELESINHLFIETRDILTSDQINDIVTSYSQIEVINPAFLMKEVLPFILKKSKLAKLTISNKNLSSICQERSLFRKILLATSFHIY